MIFFIISCSPNYKEMSTEKIKVKLNKLIKKEKKGSLSTRDFEEIQKLSAGLASVQIFDEVRGTNIIELIRNTLWRSF